MARYWLITMGLVGLTVLVGSTPEAAGGADQAKTHVALSSDCARNVDLPAAPLTDPSDPGQVNTFAFQFLQGLLWADGSQPKWEFEQPDAWHTKCVLFHQPCPAGAPRAIMAPAPQGAGSAPTLASSTQKPQLQEMGLRLRSFEPPVQTKALQRSMAQSGPRIGAVMYNCAASSAITAMEASFRKNRPAVPTSLPGGSVIVKAIWAPVEPVNGAPLHILFPLSTLNHSQERQFAGDPKLQDLSLPAPTDGKPTAGWALATVDGAGGTAAVGCAVAHLPVSLDCFHAYKVDRASTQFLSHITDTFNPFKDFDANAMAVLVGLNIMVRPADGADWVWISLWWNGNDHAHPLSAKDRLPGPWRYYEVAASNRDRTQLPSDSNPNILFNPYLEGQTGNGRVSNCRTCHSYASFKNDAAQHSNSVMINTPGFPGSPGADTLHTASPDPSVFFKAGDIATDSVWSLAGFNTPQP